jgi:hypothetical protein
MEGLMNFGCFLAEEERSEIDFSGGMAMRAGSSVLRVVSGPACGPACQSSLGCPLIISGGTDHIQIESSSLSCTSFPSHFPALAVFLTRRVSYLPR